MGHRFLIIRGVNICFSLMIILFTAWINGCVQPKDIQRLEIATIDLQTQQRKTQAQLNDLESRLETQRQSMAGEIQKVEKAGEPVKKHLADMFSRLDRMETRIQEITGLSDEDRYRFQQIISGLKSLEESVQKKLAPLEQQIQSLESQVKALLESYQATASQMRQLGSFQKSAADRLAKVEREIKSSTLDRAKPPAETQVKKPPVTKELAHQELYQKARETMNTGEYESACKLFQEYLNKYPKESLASNAQYWIGECYYNQGKYEEAILQFDKVVQQYPKSDKVPGAILKEAMAFGKMGDKEGCRLFLNKVIQDYPNSSDAKKAAQELQKLK